MGCVCAPHCKFKPFSVGDFKFGNERFKLRYTIDSAMNSNLSDQARLSAASKCRRCKAIWARFSNRFCADHSTKGWRAQSRTASSRAETTSQQPKPPTLRLCYGCNQKKSIVSGSTRCQACWSHYDETMSKARTQRNRNARGGSHRQWRQVP